MKNREIKFRAWNSSEGKMVDLQELTPLALDANMNSILKIEGKSGLFIPFFPEIDLMQYTGLKDKYGVEIYEGDILEHYSEWKKETHIFEVRYLNNFGSFMGVNEEIFKNAPQYLEYWPKEAKIIGNIYQNPELCK